MRSGVPTRSSTPTWTPLALTVLLHLLLVLAWRCQVRTAPAPAPIERLIELVQVRPPAQLPSSESAAPAQAPTAPRKAGKTTPTIEAAPIAAPLDHPPAERLPAEQPPAVAETPPQAAQATTGEAPVTLEGEALLAAGKRSAAAFDREQRKGKSGVPLEADTPWSRFRAAVASAHIDSSMSMRLEKYEAVDGVVIYRTTQNGRQTCRMSGAVVFGPGRAGGGSAAGNVTCPKGVRWEQL